LIELMVVVFMIGIITSILLSNFKTSQTNAVARRQTASLIVADIRKAQSMALSGVDYNGIQVCGFGLHYVNGDSYLLYYTKPPDLNTVCANVSRLYQVGQEIQTKTVNNSNLALLWSPGADPRDDIFFELPDPKTYIADSTDPNRVATIGISYNGASCPSADCTQITVTTAGKIDIIN